MKKYYSLLMACCLGFAVQAQMQYNVTLQVDMSNETVSMDGVHVAGGFQGWDPAATMLTDDDMDGVYEITLAVDEGDHEFKFLNGNDWPFEEIVPDACRADLTGNTNRKITVTEDMTYAVCFGSCAACGMNTVLFRVDMSLQDEIAPQGVHVAGNFQGWDPGATMLTDEDGDMVYSVAYSFDPTALDAEGGNLIFKYINGNDWPFPNENVPADCGDGTGNRLIELESTNYVTDAFCFDACGSCVAPTEVTFQVDMSLQTVSPNGVHIAGAFQGWDPGADMLSDDDMDGIYEITLMVAPGSYEYKFINGNAWEGDDNDNESVPAECNTNGNRLIVVEADMPQTVTYCYNQCTAACVNDPDPADITFSVNMQDEVVSADGVWLMGGFSSPQWQEGAMMMSDDDADGIYTLTANISGPAEFQYKFTNGDPYPDGTVDGSVEETYDFTLGGCGVENGIGGFNRTHVRSGMEETLDIVCYNSCVDCGIGIYGQRVEAELNIFPNPTSGVINISTNDMQGATNLTVIDAQGRAVIVSQVVINEGQLLEVDLQELPAGFYTLQLLNGNTVANQLVVRK
ncbi:MAG: T9SS type A sorting domain-containing protein [Flavobacteriales bacterium]|nr:T9SS type A sorting domain-containing protein [Flavobacteriales bacterium]